MFGLPIELGVEVNSDMGIDINEINQDENDDLHSSMAVDPYTAHDENYQPREI